MFGYLMMGDVCAVVGFMLAAVALVAGFAELLGRYLKWKRGGQ